MTAVYIAGPMTGLPDFNYPAFHRAADQLTRAGHTPINPAGEFVSGWTWEDYLRRGLRQLLDAEGVAVLPGWERSRGARLEMCVAGQLGMPVRPLPDWLGDVWALASPEWGGAWWPL